MLGPASSALEGAATSAANAGSSLTSSAEAADQAAVLTTRLASSFEGLSALSSFEILGARPFAGLAGEFTQVGADARALSTDLVATAAALRTNVADSDGRRHRPANAGDPAGPLATSLRRRPMAGASGARPPLLNAARIVLLGLLVWLAVPARAQHMAGLAADEAEIRG